ncbi:hypothetical protein BABINDRAFT_11148 [Babjeviella inositovora NRRL Y-12698]|uniref:Dynactin subunit 2 n=1 Tax=Babjeviella inositovora NRRL Y-12698 TaxID=984486 RepID=A0A1E3QYL6_9ASCO|nr:uncharacterized protein BABINDRAFT_11148 [Babjeviella inositovora NRRL Y-12698]ODQ82779.1 hypothetical protein BABINDRAFT_11148 [Babjeviella inositovora NRRL Y-12698]
MSKYSELPDVEVDAQDCFETSDVDEVESIDTSVYEAEEKDIDQSKVLPEHARLRFENYLIDGCRVDFSDSIVPKKGSYASAHLAETPAQKLLRIRRELEELALVQDESAVLKHELEGLQSMVQKLNQKPVGPSVVSYQPESTPESGVALPPKQGIQLVQEFLLLESRLAKLEAVVGYDFINSEAKQSIQALINDLSRKINILYMESELLKADGEEKRFAKLLASVAELNKKSEMIYARRNTSATISSLMDGETSHTEPHTEPHTDLHTAPPEAKKLLELYAKFRQISQLDSTTRHIVDRLRSLHEMHTQISHSLSVCESISDTVTDVTESIDHWQAAIRVVEEKLAKEQGVWNRSSAEILRMLEKLETRVGTLE